MIEKYKDILFEIIDLLKSEQRYIEEFDLKELKHSGTKKNILLQELIEVEKDIIDKRLFEKIEEDERFFIKNSISLFRELVSENHQKIRYMCEVNQNAIEMIFSNMKEANGRKFHYAEKGELN